MTLLLRGCASDAVAGCVALTLCEKAFSDNAPAWRCLTCKSLRLQAAKSQSGLMHPSKKALLVDHLVGEDVELRRDRHSERVGGLAIDHQVEFRRLLDRQVARLGALDNLVDERCGAAEEIEEALADGSTVPADHRQPGRAPLGKSVFEATHLEAACTQRCDRFVGQHAVGTAAVDRKSV